MTTLLPSSVPVSRRRLLPWAALAVALTALNLRTAVTGFTPLLEIIGDDLGFGLALAGLLGTVPAATFGVFGFSAPVVTRRFGLERTATAALGLSALAIVLRALSPTPAVLVASTVLALAGIGAANVVIVPLVKVWFADRIALWTSAYLLLMQTGQFVAPLEGTVLWVCALGIGVSTFPLCMTLINHRTRSPQVASTVSGFVQGIGYGLAAVGPVGLGLLREATGSWTTPLVVLAATAVPGVVAGWVACRPRSVEDSKTGLTSRVG